MNEDLKHIIDLGAFGTALGSFYMMIIDTLPHVITGLSSFLALIWLALRVHGELVDRGYIKGRKKTHHD